MPASGAETGSSVAGVIEIETELGMVHFSGQDTGRPLLLMISGVFAVRDFLNRLPDRFPQLDVLRAHLPGNHCPTLAATSVGCFAAAYSAALDRRFAGRNVVLFGFSVGAVVAMAMRSPSIRAVLAIEPPLVTGEAWPLVELRESAPPGNEDFLWSILGVGSKSFQSRDYRPILDSLRVPTRVLLGDEPPPAGQSWVETQGFVGPLSREALRGNPLIEVIDLPGVGHHVVRQALWPMLDALQGTLKETFGSEAAAIQLPDGLVRPAPQGRMGGALPH